MQWIVILTFWIHGREKETELPGHLSTQTECMREQHVWEQRFNTSEPHAMFCRSTQASGDR
jgi:hypothetical protein